MKLVLCGLLLLAGSMLERDVAFAIAGALVGIGLALRTFSFVMKASTVPVRMR